ncbi:MAG: hypothetical protein KBC62_02060 [Candidatus Pacebacteria bacterium]|nr:hypothetical protein [Candidatus Paceibacterota bacterium]
MESPEKKDSSEKYIERAIESNEAFLAELDTIDTLEELKDALHDLAYVTNINGENCSILPEITPEPGTEDVQVQIFLEEDIVRSIGVLMADPMTDTAEVEQEVRGWIGHRDIANAVIRIITKNLNG